MFFYVDESGNTGLNLFDPAQPTLYYGVIGCQKNLDTLAAPMLAKLRSDLGVHRLHANELGAARLAEIAAPITEFSLRHDLRLFFYRVVKRDHAVMMFFDQVFDAGLNDAVSWHTYWTPLRYMLLFKVAYLFDEQLAQRAWGARREQNPDRCAAQLRKLCTDLIERVPFLPDERSQTLVADALRWARANPDKIAYGSSNRESTLQISANLVGFQQVLLGIALHTKKRGRKARKIIVDRQTEFNAAQDEIADIYRRLRGHKTSLGPGMPEANWTTMPEAPPEFRGGDESAGLELVDLSLWCAKRIDEKRQVPTALRSLFWSQARRGHTDEISFRGLDRRWRHILELPEPDEAQRRDVMAMLSEIEEKRLAAVKSL